MFNKKEYLVNLSRKRSGKFRKIKKGIFLDRNERSIPFSKKISNDLSKLILNIDLTKYPNFDNFYKLLSKKINIPKDQLYLTEGVSGGIKSILECFTEPGKNNIIYPSPSFAMYDVYSKMFNLKKKYIEYKNNNLDFQSVYNLIDKKTAVIFIPNPNIPVETHLSELEICKLARICDKKNIILAIDEVYFLFNKVSYIYLIKKFKNLIILQSFSKAYGLASIRLGYIIGQKNNIEYISKTRTGYETNAISIEIASYFLNNKYIINEYISKIKKGIQFLNINLAKIGIASFGGKYSNYIFINFKSKKIKNIVLNKLIDKNIFVRDGWGKPYDKGFLISGAKISIMKIIFKEIHNLKNKL